MIVGDLDSRQLGAALRGSGLRIRTGPVAFEVRSGVPEVQAGVALHYASYPLLSNSEFTDFHVSVDRPRALRRWLAPQVMFGFDGTYPFAPLPGDQGFPMLEWGMNWCVYSHCQQFLMVHAAVLERDGRALLLPAPSGSGKSTLCAGLVYRGGWRLLSDELALIDLGSLRVTPMPRPVSLKNASIDVIRRLAPELTFSAPVNETVKGVVAHARVPADAVARSDESALPAWLVLPRYAAGEPASLRPLTKARGFMALVDNSFNYVVHGREGFLAFGRLIDRLACREFVYGDLAEALGVFDRLAREAR